MTCLIHYPWLHPKLARLEGLPEVNFFDPGVDMQTDASRWRPEDLPLSNLEVRRLLHNYLQFGEQFAKAEDMGFFKVKGMDNFYADTGLEFRSQLMGGDDAAKSEDPLARKKQAQLVLALALFREEQYVAMREQETRFTGAREKFAEVLGLDDEEVFAEIAAPTDDAIFPRASVDLSWRELLEPLLCFLPPDACLFISDSDIHAELQALGLTFQPCDIDGATYVCCDLDDIGLALLCGKQLAVTGSVRLVARPLNP